eukprot:scaffold27699_cov41-Cyclotella_meneghiniana.AAC.2
MTFTKCWNFYSQEVTSNEAPKYEDSMNFVFANTQEEESIYTLTVSEIAEAQKEDAQISNKTSSRMVSSLPAASWVYSPGRNFERLHVLERYAPYSPGICQEL